MAPGIDPPLSTTSARESLWLRDVAGLHCSPLAGAVAADVAVVGAGIAGVTTALRLQRAGTRVVLVEAGEVAAGVTANNTAKVTALQSTMLSTITSRHGAQAAATYAAASSWAVQDVARWAAEEGIDCDLERRPAVTYAASESERRSVHREFEAAREAGLDVRWSEDDGGLPFPVAGAVWLDDQVGLHPVKYVRGLARAFLQAGGQIFEHSRVVSVHSGSPCEVRTAAGHVRADQVVIATHYPMLDRGLFFARLDAQRSYCIAVAVSGTPARAMAINPGTPTRSVQPHGQTLIVGGEGHGAGARKALPERFQALEDYAREHWDAGALVGRWSAQDPVPYDHLPMIGPLVPRSRRLWVATGWAKWGLSGGTLAARILADGIQGSDHEWGARLTPNRLSLRSSHEVAELGGKFSALMALDRVTPAEVSSADDVPAGQARVLRSGLGKTGVFRDEQGTVHAVSLRCTHMGCLLRFNAAERSWDCPCHGSRFGVDGSVLEGPAVAPLQRRAL